MRPLRDAGQDPEPGSGLQTPKARQRPGQPLEAGSFESPRRAPHSVEQKTPLKQSIGLTPEMRRLEQLRLSSGQRGKPQLSKVTDQAKSQVRRDLMAEIDSSAGLTHQQEKQPVEAPG